MKKHLLAAFGLLFLLVSCNEKKVNPKSYLPESTGAVNSLIVVMPNDLWKGSVGDKVRERFAAPVLGLSWEEAQLSIEQVPPSIFEGSITRSRSVLYVLKDSVSNNYISPNVYSRPQHIAVVKGTDNENLIANVEAIADKAVKAFKDNEISEAQRRFKRSLSKETTLKDEFGIELTLPSVYRVGKHEDNFVWIDRRIDKGHMNIIAYTMPDTSFRTDSTFVRDIVAMRDSIGKKYIPGPNYPNTDSYVITEKVFSPYVFPAEVGGKKGVEVRGIWEMKNDFMAGPFLTYILNDKEHNRKLVLEGFTYAPSTEKRDYMFELEAVLKSVRFVKSD